MSYLSSYDNFVQEAKKRMEEAGGDSCFFIMYLDIAGFQLVNDFYGIEEGDRLLLALEAFLKQLPNAQLCSRVFSDHYLQLTRLEDGVEPARLNEQLRESLGRFLQMERVHHKSCSLYIIGGLCRVKHGREGITAAIDNANIARKKAKGSMRTNLLWFDDEMEERLNETKRLEVELQKALYRDEFTFRLQPKVNLRSGKIVGAEALARWIQPDGTEVSPASFIPVMEQNQTIVTLDFMIYHKVCRYLKTLMESGSRMYPVSVNMSRRHIQYPDTAQRIHSLVSNYGIPPYLLEFELTESVLMEDFSIAKSIMSELRGYGYKTSIDDFGSGYSGIMVFQELDFDVLKLDRSFLNMTAEKAMRNDAIVKRIVRLATDLQTAVLCEGVETEEQAGNMMHLGCSIAQGYYFSRPLPMEEFQKLYEEKKGYFELPWLEKREDSIYAPEHIDMGLLPDAQVRSITQSFFHMMPCGIAGVDDKNRILFATPMFYTLIGYTKEELTICAKHHWWDGLSVEYEAAYNEKAIKEKLDLNQTIHFEYFTTRKNGERVYISMYGGRVSSPEWGSYTLCAFFDETEHKNNESQRDKYQEQLALERERANLRMRTAVEMLEVCIAEYDFETRMIRLPLQGYEMDQMEPGVEELSLDDFIKMGMVREDYLDAYMGLFTQMETQDDVYLEFPYQIKKGVYHWTSLTGKVAVRENGKPIRCIGIYRLIEDKNEDRKEDRGKTKARRFAGLAEKAPKYKKSVEIGLALLFGGLTLVTLHLGYSALSVKSILYSSSLLATAALAVGAIAFYTHLHMKKRITFDDERYAVLSEFSDTILFQYFYKLDTIMLTPNAKERFEVLRLQKKNYLRDNQPILRLYADDWVLVREMLEHPAPEGEIKTIHVRLKGREGGYLWCSYQMSFLYEKGEATVAVGKITDISNQKKLEEQLKKQAQTDGLTQIYNKTAVERKISEQLEAGVPGFLFIMDMDDFKLVNDRYGHVRGDEALACLGKVLKEVFYQKGIVGRIGGDEFVAYIPQGEEQMPAKEQASLVLENISALFRQEGVEMTLSIGISAYPKDGNTYKEIYEAADSAMYAAKRLGKNRYFQK